VADTALLEGRGLTKAYGSTVAVESFSFELQAGQTLGLIGESGSGKSTIARLVAGLEPADGGELTLDGRPLGQRRSLEERRAIQVIFQDPLAALNPRLTVLEAIEDFLTIHKTGDRAARRAAALQALESVHLSPDVGRSLPREMSGGQRQRACIARALALNPRILVADEPTSALDASIQGQILNLFVEVQRERGMALIFISHDIAVVRYVAEHLVVLRDGRVIDSGPRDEVSSSPADDYTARLLTAMAEI
jgi:ABC-type glutathione transport system ATPase component